MMNITITITISLINNEDDDHGFDFGDDYSDDDEYSTVSSKNLNHCDIYCSDK